MNSPWFFLSYANSTSGNKMRVEKFFSDLRKELATVAELRDPEESIGFCASDILLGNEWPEELAQKLVSRQVLVCLYSAKYFKSDACGKEFYIFHSRVKDGVSSNSKTVPVLWSVEKNFTELLPRRLRSIQYEDQFFETVLEFGGVTNLEDSQRTTSTHGT